MYPGGDKFVQYTPLGAEIKSDRYLGRNEIV